MPHAAVPRCNQVLWCNVGRLEGHDAGEFDVGNSYGHAMVLVLTASSFFALLIVIIIGFLQGFIGMDNTEDKGEVTTFILRAMTNAILGSPEFDGFVFMSQFNWVEANWAWVDLIISRIPLD